VEFVGTIAITLPPICPGGKQLWNNRCSEMRHSGHLMICHGEAGLTR
jgi:hypothetical protein